MSASPDNIKKFLLPEGQVRFPIFDVGFGVSI